MINPFNSDEQRLVNLSSGVVATNDVTEDMKKMQERGEDAVHSFINTRILTEEPDIHSPIKRVSLKTFSSMSSKVKAKNGKGEVIALKNSKDLFAKMILLATSRHLDMREVLKYSLRPFPLPIATAFGGLAKTTKARLLHVIEEAVVNPYVEAIQGNNAVMIDGMALLQTLSTIPATFKELANMVLMQISTIAVSLQCTRADFVCDRYPVISIKNLDREKRANDGAQVIRIYDGQQRVPRQWKKFMSSGENKEAIQEFLFQSWLTSSPDMLKGVHVYVTHHDKCHRLVPSGEAVACEEILELFSDHEEADTRLILHASHAAQMHTKVVIRSPDTDVFFIALNASLAIPSQLFFLTGIGNSKRIISMDAVKNELGQILCKALIGLHAFTGKI